MESESYLPSERRQRPRSALVVSVACRAAMVLEFMGGTDCFSYSVGLIDYLQTSYSIFATCG